MRCTRLVLFGMAFSVPRMVNSASKRSCQPGRSGMLTHGTRSPAPHSGWQTLPSLDAERVQGAGGSAETGCAPLALPDSRPSPKPRPPHFLTCQPPAGAVIRGQTQSYAATAEARISERRTLFAMSTGRALTRMSLSTVLRTTAEQCTLSDGPRPAGSDGLMSMSGRAPIFPPARDPRRATSTVDWRPADATPAVVAIAVAHQKL